jgi:hypothetical protein
MNCCGGLKPPLVSPAGRSKVWFDPRRAYEPFDLDGPRFRAAVGRYDERADNLLAELHWAWCWAVKPWWSNGGGD